MRILKADHLGMCFGVRDAIALARREAARGPVTVVGRLVHNETVVGRLRREGVSFTPDPDGVTTPVAIITAHGTSDRRREALRDRGLEVADATCPLVHRAHEALGRLVRDGFHPVIIGIPDHVEVRGLAEDHPGVEIVRDEAGIDSLPIRPRYGVVSQTTQPVARVRALVARLRDRMPESLVRWIDTVCRPTKERQEAAEALAAEADVVVVVGGPLSNNTRELAATCRLQCPRVHPVATVEDLRREWFGPDDTVGLTAGTSTPDDVIDAIERRLREWATGCRDTDDHVARPGGPLLERTAAGTV